MKEEGSAGRKKMETYTYILTVPMAMLSGIGQVRLFSTQGEIIKNFGFGAGQVLPTLSVILTMTAGTFFAIWLGEMITEQGIGQGLSIIIFGGIVARLPQNIAQLLADPTKAAGSLIAFIVIVTLIVLVIVVVQEGQRRIPVQYGKRVRGRKVYGGGSTHIPLKVNMAGMIPLIFAQSLLTLPAIICADLCRLDRSGCGELLHAGGEYLSAAGGTRCRSSTGCCILRWWWVSRTSTRT